MGNTEGSIEKDGKIKKSKFSKFSKKPKKSGLGDVDFKFLTTQTGRSKEEIKNLYQKFMTDNLDGKMNKKEFVKLYTSLRPESDQNLDKISESVFRAFDKDRNGYLTFDEFMIAFAITSHGDLDKRLEYAFILYDADGNGYLDENEIKEGIAGMLDLMYGDSSSIDLEASAKQYMKELDVSNDGRVTKDEFINGLKKSHLSRALMNPFS